MASEQGFEQNLEIQAQCIDELEIDVNQLREGYGVLTEGQEEIKKLLEDFSKKMEDSMNSKKEEIIRMIKGENTTPVLWGNTELHIYGEVEAGMGIPPGSVGGSNTPNMSNTPTGALHGNSSCTDSGLIPLPGLRTLDPQAVLESDPQTGSMNSKLAEIVRLLGGENTTPMRFDSLETQVDVLNVMGGLKDEEFLAKKAAKDIDTQVFDKMPDRKEVFEVSKLEGGLLIENCPKITGTTKSDKEIDDLIKSLINFYSFDGDWVKDYSYPLCKPNSCSLIDEQFNYSLIGRLDNGYLRHKWKQKSCKNQNDPCFTDSLHLSYCKYAPPFAEFMIDPGGCLFDLLRFVQHSPYVVLLSKVVNNIEGSCEIWGTSRIGDELLKGVLEGLRYRSWDIRTKEVFELLQISQIDTRVLGTIAIEHSKDSDEVVVGVLEEIITFFSERSTSSSLLTCGISVGESLDGSIVKIQTEDEILFSRFYCRLRQESFSCKEVDKMVNISLRENFVQSASSVYFKINDMDWIIGEAPGHFLLNIVGWKKTDFEVVEIRFDEHALKVAAPEGIGIFSLVGANVAAKDVDEMECSCIADIAQKMVKINGFSNVIDVLKGKIEEIEQPLPNIDIIINELMGYFLVYEDMLNTDLYARDKWLVQDGLALPDKASLQLTTLEDVDYKENEIAFWNNIYGFDMSCILKKSISEPLVETLEHNQIPTNCQLLKRMNISMMASVNVSLTASLKFLAEPNDYIHAFVAYFDVSFIFSKTFAGDSEFDVDKKMIAVSEIDAPESDEIKKTMWEAPNDMRIGTEPISPFVVSFVIKRYGKHGLIRKEDPMIDLFYRVLNVFEDELSGRDYPRTWSEIVATGKIMSAMGTQCAPHIVQAWYVLFPNFSLTTITGERLFWEVDTGGASIGNLWTFAMIAMVIRHLAMNVSKWYWITHAVIWRSIIATFICIMIIDELVLYDTILVELVVIIANSNKTFLWTLASNTLTEIDFVIDKCPDNEKDVSFGSNVVEWIVSLISVNDSVIPSSLNLGVFFEIGVRRKNFMLRVVKKLNDAINFKLSAVDDNGNHEADKVMGELLDTIPKRCFYGSLRTRIFSREEKCYEYDIDPGVKLRYRVEYQGLNWKELKTCNCRRNCQSYFIFQHVYSCLLGLNS